VAVVVAVLVALEAMEVMVESDAVVVVAGFAHQAHPLAAEVVMEQFLFGVGKAC
jgi:hypothetical protein